MIAKTRFLSVLLAISCSGFALAEPPSPHGEKHPQLDNLATGQWWSGDPSKRGGKRRSIIPMDVPRDQVVAFAVYTHDAGTLKMSAQLYPLKDGEPRVARLELQEEGQWRELATAKVVYPGWSAHFRIENWNNTKDVPYRVRHGAKAAFEGLIRKDPIDKNEIVVGNLSCNSSSTAGPRPRIVENLKFQNPDLLFFAGDQTYHHTQHTAGWIQFGLQFREILKDRPVIAIPDDHDVGHPNLWGEGGGVSTLRGNADGGYMFPASYVKQVERQQSWHLPDPFDATPIKQGIGVYYTRLRVGGIDFAILEDRKFKTGPHGTIPAMGPRPDHINDPKYDRKAVDVAGLKLLGDRQLKFLRAWSQDWTGAEMKCALSQTAFCGAVHLHGNPKNRLLADLDSNAWPQTGRNKALREIRRAWAPHLCGDQHLAVTVKHGIDAYGDGPYGFTSPAIVNTIYGRWWHPADEKAGPNPIEGSPLPWTGDYEDGLGNKITMLAYANPEDRGNELKRADGYGLARFNKKERTITFECWHRFADVKGGDPQFPGWPITVKMEENDGRKATHWLPELSFDFDNPVVQVIDPEGEILYTVRIQGKKFQPRVYAAGSYTVKVGPEKPDQITIGGLQARAKGVAGGKKVNL